MTINMLHLDEVILTVFNPFKPATQPYLGVTICHLNTSTLADVQGGKECCLKTSTVEVEMNRKNHTYGGIFPTVRFAKSENRVALTHSSRPLVNGVKPLWV